jgi:plastocyanin
MRTLVLALCATLVLTVAACGDASSPSPGDTAPASPTEAAASPGEPAATDAACATASAVAVEVDVTIADFAYDPEPVNVTIGQVVGWTNEDAAPHTATLDDGSCGTGTIQGGKIPNWTRIQLRMSCSNFPKNTNGFLHRNELYTSTNISKFLLNY